MIRRTALATVLLALAAACGPASTEPTLARPAAAQRDEAPPPPPDSTSWPADTASRGGGGTLGSGT
jgi:hypothetical protein